MILETAIKRLFPLGGRSKLMPRKKTIQPEPLKTFPLTLEDGSAVEIEIRNETCNIIGRGLHKRDKHQALCDQILEHVASIYLSPKGVKKVEKPFMGSARELDAEMARSGLFPEITDLQSVRKRIYPYIKSRLDILTKALEQKNKAP